MVFTKKTKGNFHNYKRSILVGIIVLSIFVTIANLLIYNYYLNLLKSISGSSSGAADISLIIEGPADNVTAPVSPAPGPPPPNTTIFPKVEISYPVNKAYISHIKMLNYSVFDDAELKSCWYSLNGGRTNTTITCGNNVTGISSVDGSNTWTVYAEDTSGNVNFDSVSFMVGIDSTLPSISIIYPRNLIYSSNLTVLNYVVFDDAELKSCWYSLNGGRTNTTITCGNNVTGISSVDGSNTWTVYAEDTSGNVNFDNVTFSVEFGIDKIPPSVLITFPENKTYTFYVTRLDFVASDDVALDSCWYSLNGGRTNTTIGCRI